MIDIDSFNLFQFFMVRLVMTPLLILCPLFLIKMYVFRQ